jgi:hypothetical protein
VKVSEPRDGQRARKQLSAHGVRGGKTEKLERNHGAV